MLVAVPPPVAAIDSVWPERPSPAELRPSFASAVPVTVRPAAGGVNVIAPALIDDVTPVADWIVDSRCATVSVTPMLVPEELEPATKVKVVPLTTSVSPVVMPLARSFEVEVEEPDSSVEPVIGIAVVASLLTTVPVTGALPEASRLVAVAPVSAAEVTVDLVE